MLSRRELFALAGCAGLAAIAACTDGSAGGVQTGPLGDNGGAPDGHEPIDAPSAIDAHQITQDAAPPDAAIGPACTGSATDVGTAATFVTGTPVYFASGRFFVVRDAGGLYALTARCTHEGVTCRVSSGEFLCPRHGAQFRFDGAIISGPVSQPLAHFAMCILANGNVGVTTTTCAKSQRLAV